MSKKLLAVDMDGTLFNDDKTISKENLDAITKLLDAGHAFAFNTGRTAEKSPLWVPAHRAFSACNESFRRFARCVRPEAGSSR